MPTIVIENRSETRRFDVRPDRVDFRDRPYRPPLLSLPPQYPDPETFYRHLSEYRRDAMLLDQRSEGACTGFGLAACINYLFWERERLGGRPTPARVSPRMLYQTARLYDEWQGEDYRGSSCRGAMKGWHRHGVCDDALWPFWDDGDAEFVEPKHGWSEDAARRPLGAYYRVDKHSIVDMQAAIYEVHAVYASAYAHRGWFLEPAERLPLIEPRAAITGGHAFAIVGYNPSGFIVQNSWGADWGCQGFAILSYEDWAKNAMDAWVAALGAPIERRASTATLSATPLQRLDAAGRRGVSAALSADAAGDVADDVAAEDQQRALPQLAPWPQSQAYRHALVLGNEGRPINRLVEAADADRALQIVSFDNPAEWLRRRRGGAKKLVIYAHGGLNDEQDSINRVRVMAPYFLDNGLYPIFITWRTGVWETLRNILDDAFEKLGLDFDWLFAEGLVSAVGDVLKEAKDRSLEVAVRAVIGKAVWTEIKQNAAAGAAREGGLNKLADQLKRLRGDFPELQLHLIGHSAGSLLLGHLLTRLTTRRLKAASMSLYAPACSVAFAVDRYGKAFAKGTLDKKTVRIDVLSDALERADAVGPYGKSLLYLVSRALEDVHKTPLLGMDAAWSAVDDDNLWHRDHLDDIKTWLTLSRGIPERTVHRDGPPPATDGKRPIRRTHGHFDNEVSVIAGTIRAIRGAKLRRPVTDLRGF